MGLKVFALKMAQAEAGVWPWLSGVCQIRSTVARSQGAAPSEDLTVGLCIGQYLGPYGGARGGLLVSEVPLYRGT